MVKMMRCIGMNIIFPKMVSFSFSLSSLFLEDETPMKRIQQNRSKWRENPSMNLEESWGSLSQFNQHQRGRLSMDMDGESCYYVAVTSTVFRTLVKSALTKI